MGCWSCGITHLRVSALHQAESTLRECVILTHRKLSCKRGKQCPSVAITCSSLCSMTFSWFTAVLFWLTCQHDENYSLGLVTTGSLSCPVKKVMSPHHQCGEEERIFGRRQTRLLEVTNSGRVAAVLFVCAQTLHVTFCSTSTSLLTHRWLTCSQHRPEVRKSPAHQPCFSLPRLARDPQKIVFALPKELAHLSEVLH